MDPRPANPNWMSFDSSLFGGGGDPAAAAFASVPVHSTTATSGSGDPFASTFPDPFADLAVLPTQGQSSAGKKVTKEDFNKDPPKPTLLDLTHQQQTDPTTTTTTPAQGDPLAALQDPFSAVSQPSRNRRVPPYNPFAASEGQTFSSGNPFADSHSNLDKSGAAFHLSSALGPEDRGLDRDGFGTGPVSRPRPKGNTGTRPGLSLPLPSKVMSRIMLCTA